MKLKDIKESIFEIDKKDIKKLKKLISNHDKVIIIGNGGSNSIASHISQDYTKQLGKRSFSFSDPSRLTCYINDYGMEEAYKKFVEEFADIDTLIILISSSGNSKNILNVAYYCIENNIQMITLSGFSKDNELKKLTEKKYLHFWVDSTDYGVVECTHQIILHTVV